MKRVVPNVVRGGRAVPIGRNTYYMVGRKHTNGGIDIGKDDKTGIEVEGGEVVKVGKNEMKILSARPMFNGISPAEYVLNGGRVTDAYNAQERYKRRYNLHNNDGEAGIGKVVKLVGKKLGTVKEAILKRATNWINDGVDDIADDVTDDVASAVDNGHPSTGNTAPTGAASNANSGGQSIAERVKRNARARTDEELAIQQAQRDKINAIRKDVKSKATFWQKRTGADGTKINKAARKYKAEQKAAGNPWYAGQTRNPFSRYRVAPAWVNSVRRGAEVAGKTAVPYAGVMTLSDWLSGGQFEDKNNYNEFANGGKVKRKRFENGGETKPFDMKTFMMMNNLKYSMPYKPINAEQFQKDIDGIVYKDEKDYTNRDRAIMRYLDEQTDKQDAAIVNENQTLNGDYNFNESGNIYKRDLLDKLADNTRDNAKYLDAVQWGSLIAIPFSAGVSELIGYPATIASGLGSGLQALNNYRRGNYKLAKENAVSGAIDAALLGADKVYSALKNSNKVTILRKQHKTLDRVLRTKDAVMSRARKGAKKVSRFVIPTGGAYAAGVLNHSSNNRPATPSDNTRVYRVDPTLVRNGR